MPEQVKTPKDQDVVYLRKKIYTKHPVRSTDRAGKGT
jgi:hypothetical protein